MSDIAQLCIFLRMVIANVAAFERTRGEDIYKVFLNFVIQYELPIHKLVSITADGAPSITGNQNEFVALCRTNSLHFSHSIVSFCDKFYAQKYKK